MRNIVITGATKGIGRAIANLFAGEGQVRLFINARNADDLNQAKIDLEAKNSGSVEVFVKPTDMSVNEEVLAFAEFVKANCPTALDILVNNAGVFIPGSIHEEEEGALEKMIQTNLYSAYHLTRALIGGMKNAKKGHVVNMCSIASQIAYPNGGSYSISKFALLGFSKVLREEMKPFGVKVTSILPGATWSDSWAGVDLPRPRLMEADDIAKVVRAAIELGDSAVLEDVVIRPQLGDL